MMRIDSARGKGGREIQPEPLSFGACKFTGWFDDVGGPSSRAPSFCCSYTTPRGFWMDNVCESFDVEDGSPDSGRQDVLLVGLCCQTLTHGECAPLTEHASTRLQAKELARPR